MFPPLHVFYVQVVCSLWRCVMEAVRDAVRQFSCFSSPQYGKESAASVLVDACEISGEFEVKQSGVLHVFAAVHCCSVLQACFACTFYQDAACLLLFQGPAALTTHISYHING